MMLAPLKTPDQVAEAVAEIAAFMRGGSLEATRPSAQDVAALAAALPAGTQIYLSAIPTRPQEELIAQAALVRAAGLEPVPHLAVRNFATPMRCAISSNGSRARRGVRRLLVIAGDRAEPAGPFRGALEAIDSGLIARSGIVEIGISGYPDGHPRIADHELTGCLPPSSKPPRRPGSRPISSRNSRSMPRRSSRGCGACAIRASIYPVRIGLAGPTSLTTGMGSVWRRGDSFFPLSRLRERVANRRRR